jgi:hypothetical protein
MPSLIWDIGSFMMGPLSVVEPQGQPVPGFSVHARNPLIWAEPKPSGASAGSLSLIVMLPSRNDQRDVVEHTSEARAAIKT